MPHTPPLLPDHLGFERRADQLAAMGFIVLPFADSAQLRHLCDGFNGMLADSPEFRTVDVTADKLVLGGFGALGTPTQFHHPWVRRTREEVIAAILGAKVLPDDGRKLEALLDRVVLRRIGQTPTAESLHRDEAPTACHGDDIYSTWLNLDPVDQYFHCCPETHHEVEGQNTGFAKITDPAQKELYKRAMRTVRVPSGSILLFFERIVHEVAPIKATADVRRMFMGLRLTYETDPLFGSDWINHWILDQAVPRLKSGQEPKVFPSAYANFSRHWQELEEWSIDKFGHLPTSAFYQHHVKSTNPAFDGRVYWRVRARFPSLKQLQADTGGAIQMHRPYDPEEVALLFPGRAWELFALGSSDRQLMVR